MPGSDIPPVAIWRNGMRIKWNNVKQAEENFGEELAKAITQIKEDNKEVEHIRSVFQAIFWTD